jgi:hypothetical protein
LPGPTDDYFAYKRWFEVGHGSLALPVDCVEPDGPVLKYSNQYTWELEWYLIFTNPHSYVRIQENFAKRAGLYMSRRINFAYHYWPITKADLRGFPDKDPADPVFVRIDNAGRPAHLHHQDDPRDHIPQSRISGLVLEDVDLFDFAKSALRHRQSGRPMAKELGYRIG